MKEFRVLDQIAQTASKKGKEALLRDNDSPTLRNICLYAYDTFRTYRVQQLELPDKFNVVQPDVSRELFLLLDLLATHTVTPTEAKGMIKRLLAKCSEDGAKWVCRIINRDLKIGCGINTMNKAFPNLIKEFKVQLANPMVEHSKGIEHWDDVEYPCYADEKVDGMFVAAVCTGETVNYFARSGLEITTLDHLTPQILKLRPGTNFVLIGESIGVVYNPRCATAKKSHDAGKPWAFCQGLSMTKSAIGTYSREDMLSCLGYIVWDLIDYDWFLNQGAVGRCEPLSKRRTELFGLFERLSAPLHSIKLLPGRIISSKVEAVTFFKEVISANGEGIVLKKLAAPYEFKRNNNQIKVKGYYTADLRVVDCEEGTKGTRKEGSLGNITVSDGEITGKLMGGWDDDEGLEMWFRFQRGEFVNTIVECAYMEVTVDKSLRHAVFVRERGDKKEISWG